MVQESDDLDAGRAKRIRGSGAIRVLPERLAAQRWSFRPANDRVNRRCRRQSGRKWRRNQGGGRCELPVEAASELNSGLGLIATRAERRVQCQVAPKLVTCSRISAVCRLCRGRPAGTNGSQASYLPPRQGGSRPCSGFVSSATGL